MQHSSTFEAHSEIADSTLADATLLPAHDSVVGTADASGATFVPPLRPRPNHDAGLPPILVADDDPDDTFFIQRLIKKTGVNNPVTVFDDGSEVVNYLGARLTRAGSRRPIPHLLFLDLRMAGLGGFGFLEWAREQRNLMPLTIVVLSNSNEPADVARALELGAHRYLVKYPCVQTINTIVRSVYPQVIY